MFEDSKEQKLYVAFELQSLHGFEKSTKAQYYFKKTLFVSMQQYLAMVSKFATTAAHPFCCSFCSHTRFSQLSAISTASEWKS